MINYVEKHVNNNFVGTQNQQLRDTPAKPSHGRSESRLYTQFKVPKDFPNASLWAGLMTIGLVVYTFIRDGKEQTDIRCYLCSLPLMCPCLRNAFVITGASKTPVMES